MKRRIVIWVASALGLPFLLVGCDRTVSSEENTEIKSDGTVETERETVTRNADGTVTKTEEEKKTTPANP